MPIGFLTQLAFGFLTRLAMVGGLAACRARVDRPTGSVSGYAMSGYAGRVNAASRSQVLLKSIATACERPACASCLDFVLP